MTDDYITDANKLSIIEAALRNAYAALDKRYNDLVAWNATTQSEFQTMFGTTSADARKEIMERIYCMKEHIILNNFIALKRDFYTGKMKRGYTEQFFETNDDSYAHVYHNDVDMEIYLDKSFWTAPALGRDSQMGTIVHEMSHFSGVAGKRSKDYRYGLIAAKQFAISDPKKALYNADNFEYFIEGGPY